MDAVVDITGVAHGGDGVCRIDDRVCFVPYALPGDRLRIVVEREAKGVLWGVLADIVEPSPHRQDATGCCPVGRHCGACGWLHFAYPAQAEWKRRIVLDSLQRIARVEADVEWVEDPELRLGYRTRAEFHGDGSQWGYYLRATHAICPVRQCPLCHPHLNAALERLWQAKITDSVEITANPEAADEVLVWTKQHHSILTRLFPGYNSLRSRDDRSAFLFDNIPIVNGTFSQSSLLLDRRLTAVARELVGPVDTLLDLYCGSGNFSLGMPDSTRVVGIDHNRAAIAAAAAQGRGEYRVGDEAAMGRALREGAWDAVLLDPPRAGAKALVPHFAEADAHAVVYVSCDPATLARDIKSLVSQGWRLERVVAVDMFPHTPHVEAVARLVRDATA